MLKLTKLPVILLLLAIAFFGCDKKSASDKKSVPEKESRIRLKSYTDGGGTYTYTYDNKGRVSRIVLSREDKLVSEDDYTYSGDYLSEINSKVVDRIDGVLKLSLNQRYTWISATELRVEESAYMNLPYLPSDAILTYDQKTGSVIKAVRFRGNTKTVNSVVTYTRDTRGNYVKKKQELYDQDKVVLTTESVSEYDDKPNPFYQLPDPVYFVDNTCPNNQTSELYKHPKQPDQVVKYQFEYNKQGYPVKKTSDAAGAPKPVTYIYESY